MKKFYSLILFMCLAIGNAWAGSGLYIFGEEVNVSTSWTRNASSFVSGATGTISYIYDTGTIKFNNVKITTVSHGKKVVYNKSQTQLDIIFEGECIFFSTDNIIKYDVWTILDGSASTKVEMHVRDNAIGDDKETIYSNQSDVSAKLEINNFPYLRLTSLGDYCISHKKGGVNIKDSHILMESTKGTIHSNFYNWTHDWVHLENCHYAGNYVYDDSGDSYDVITRTSGTGTEKVKKAIILRDSEYTGVRLNGEAVLTSDSRWNASTKTLTLNADVNASSNFTYKGAITIQKRDITIDGGGYTCTGKQYGMYVYNQQTTVKNITLSGPYSGLWSWAGDVTVGDNVAFNAIDYGIYNYFGSTTFSPSSGKGVTLAPYQGISETTYGTLFRNKTIRTNYLTLKDCDIYPQGLVFSDTTIVSGTTPYKGIVNIKGWEKYDLYVNGTQVNEKNKDNLTSLLGSNATGTLKYNPSTNILTMNNLKAAPAYNPYGYTHLIAGKSLTIVVEGENEITASMTNFCTIVSTGLTITKGSTSTSKLTLKGTPVQGFFISTSSPVIIDVTLAIEGNGNEIGIYNDNGIGFINNATISIKNAVPLYGMWATSGVYGNLQRSDGPAITINPSTKQLVYFYDNATSPSTDVVTEAINIYPTGTYSVKVNGNTPQSYTEQNGVCYDEFSNRLYLRNTSVNGKITFSRSDYESNMWSPTIYTIGDCSVTNSDIPFAASVHGLTFTGPGTLNLTNAGTKEAAARFTGCSGDVVVKNTTLKTNAAAGLICTHSDYTSYLRVINSTLEAHGTSGYYIMAGFTSLVTSGCILYIPQNGYYYNTDNYHGNLRKADGTVASDMIILLEAPQGDLNVDGKVDIADAVTVLNIMAAGGYEAKADLNDDQKVDIADFVAVLNLMAKQKQ